MSRWTRASTASSLLALSLLASGCGESNTHSAGEVQRAFDRHGLVLDAESAAVPPEWRDIASARSLRIEILAAGAGVRLLGLAERKVDVVDLVGEDVGVAVLVLSDPQSALLFRIPGTLRFDNLIVHGAGRPAVRAALDDLD